jgi:hypothetical protein
MFILKRRDTIYEQRYFIKLLSFTKKFKFLYEKVSTWKQLSSSYPSGRYKFRAADDKRHTEDKKNKKKTLFYRQKVIIRQEVAKNHVKNPLENSKFMKYYKQVNSPAII